MPTPSPQPPNSEEIARRVRAKQQLLHQLHDHDRRALDPGAGVGASPERLSRRDGQAEGSASPNGGSARRRAHKLPFGGEKKNPNFSGWDGGEPPPPPEGKELVVERADGVEVRCSPPRHPPDGYALGSHVHVRRSAGGWSPGVVSRRDEMGRLYGITFTGDDGQMIRKFVSFDRAPLMLRPADEPPEVDCHPHEVECDQGAPPAAAPAAEERREQEHSRTPEQQPAADSPLPNIRTLSDITPRRAAAGQHTRPRTLTPVSPPRRSSAGGACTPEHRDRVASEACSVPPSARTCSESPAPEWYTRGTDDEECVLFLSKRFPASRTGLELATDHASPGGPAALVMSVADGSVAQQAGVQPGWWLCQVGHINVPSAEDAMQLLHSTRHARLVMRRRPLHASAPPVCAGRQHMDPTANGRDHENGALDTETPPPQHHSPCRFSARRGLWGADDGHCDTPPGCAAAAERVSEVRRTLSALHHQQQQQQLQQSLPDLQRSPSRRSPPPAGTPSFHPTPRSLHPVTHGGPIQPLSMIGALACGEIGEQAPGSAARRRMRQSQERQQQQQNQYHEQRDHGEGGHRRCL
eukprot:TRINITY_DN16814_c0_g1_i1.p1 TRINITY_DN16814_c0_g1~~TRINITY_DN16814_c0_g1_i1.p1  ORF type:complete len:581 (+),score=114.52 TRINITY_DN16814_c0_g1_i1:99-1841(+)